MKRYIRTIVALVIVISSVVSLQQIDADDVPKNNIQIVEGGIEDKFTDQNLLNYVRSALKLSATEPITETNIKKLKSIQINKSVGNEVKQLNGLEYAMELKTIIFDYHSIEDFKPIENLVNLGIIRVSNNSTPINNFSLIGNLPKVSSLNFSNTKLDDVSIQAISKLPLLTHIALTNTGISDISFLSNLENLNTVYLSENKIVDISSLAGKSLQNLWLDDNLIEDVSVLAGNQYRNGLYLYNNKISDISALSPQTSDLLSIVLYGNRILNVGNINPKNVLASKASFQRGEISIGKIDFDSSEIRVSNPLVGFEGYGVIEPSLDSTHEDGAYRFDLTNNQLVFDMTKITPIYNETTKKHSVVMSWDQVDENDSDIRFQGRLVIYMEPINKYTVTYTDGVDSEIIFADESYTVKEGGLTPEFSKEITRYGYTFDGWSPLIEPTVNEDVTYVAQWKKIDTFTVTYTDGVDGEEIFKDQTSTVYRNDPSPIFEGEEPVRTGYIFKGWSPEYVGVVAENIIYTATWGKITVPAKEYLVIYTDGTNEEAVFTNQVTSVPEGAATPLFKGDIVRNGYTFEGWNPEIALTVSKDVIYVAQWKKVELPIEPEIPVKPVEPSDPNDQVKPIEPQTPILPSTGVKDNHFSFFTIILGISFISYRTVSRKRNNQ